jgi:glycosyltransferase involved in cell wall biosynthesis
MNPSIWRRRRVVFFTHPSEDWGITEQEWIYSLNHADRVVLMNRTFRDLLEGQGLDRRKSAVLLGGADPNLFRGHRRTGGVVGLCSAFYPRKSPDLILNIMRAMPHRQFLLIGRGWDKYERMNELAALSNFRYVEAPYEAYPEYYREMDVFLSAATIEGGPIPLLEAMMSNAVPVATKTGFAPELIERGQNGFLFEQDTPVSYIVNLIESAYSSPVDVRRTVEHLTWDRFASEAHRLLTTVQ